MSEAKELLSDAIMDSDIGGTGTVQQAIVYNLVMKDDALGSTFSYYMPDAD